MSENEQHKGIITLSITQIIFIIVGLFVLYFVIIKPSIARGVCYNEAFRRDYRTQEPYRSGNYADEVKLGIAGQNRDESYQTCKVYSAGKVWEQFIFKDLRL